MSLRWTLGPLILLAGCSKLTDSGNGAVAIELRLPSGAAVEPGDTIQLKARALNADGDSIGATILWRTPDSTLTMVDPSGLLTTDSTSGTGRVQARVGNLFSDFATINVHPRSDTLVLIEPDTLVVASGDTASAPLVAQVQTRNPDGGVINTAISYVVDDSSNATIHGKVRLTGGGLSYRAVTGVDGGPTTPVILRRIGTVQPPVVRVTISAYRPSQAQVPGSNQIFVVLFQ
jgi:hypothetical protein